MNNCISFLNQFKIQDEKAYWLLPTQLRDSLWIKFPPEIQQQLLDYEEPIIVPKFLLKMRREADQLRASLE